MLRIFVTQIYVKVVQPSRLVSVDWPCLTATEHCVYRTQSEKSDKKGVYRVSLPPLQESVF